MQIGLDIGSTTIKSPYWTMQAICYSINTKDITARLQRKFWPYIKN